MKILFWLVIAANVAVLSLLFVLGLAAAPSSKTSAWAVAGTMLVVPGLLLGAAIVLFTRTSSPALRVVALVLAASPWLVVVALKAFTGLQVAAYTDSDGKLAHFRAGPLREIADAIERDDAAAVARLVPGADVNTRGFAGATLLALALRPLDQRPRDPGIVRALLGAGADPNLAAPEPPLQMALQASSKSGLEPVVLLLDAGARPNDKGPFRTPVWFTAVGATIPPGVLEAVLARGVDLQAVDGSGQNALFHAVNCLNWKAVLLLLQRGVDWRGVRFLSGLPFKDHVASQARTFASKGEADEVLDYLKRH